MALLLSVRLITGNQNRRSFRVIASASIAVALVNEPSAVPRRAATVSTRIALHLCSASAPSARGTTSLTTHDLDRSGAAVCRRDHGCRSHRALHSPSALIRRSCGRLQQPIVSSRRTGDVFLDLTAIALRIVGHTRLHGAALRSYALDRNRVCFRSCSRCSSWPSASSTFGLWRFVAAVDGLKRASASFSSSLGSNAPSPSQRKRARGPNANDPILSVTPAISPASRRRPPVRAGRRDALLEQRRARAAGSPRDPDSWQRAVVRVTHMRRHDIKREGSLVGIQVLRFPHPGIREYDHASRHLGRRVLIRPELQPRDPPYHATPISG